MRRRKVSASRNPKTNQKFPGGVAEGGRGSIAIWFSLFGRGGKRILPPIGRCGGVVSE
jgi:hypothetical protein